MPKYGKIYSLPKPLQDATSELIEEGKTEQEVADWLNAQLQRAGLKGLPPDVTQQNISSWKLRGHKRWKEYKTARFVADRIAAAAEIADPTKGDPADRLAAALIAELAIELAWVKSNYEPGDEKAKRLLQLTAGLVNLRRSNQGKAWVKIEVAKTKMSAAKLKRDDPNAQDPLEDDVPKGLSEDVLNALGTLLGTHDDTNYTYETMSKDDVEQMREKARPAIKKL
jgi:Protein of unknown function (DUF3486)